MAIRKILTWPNPLLHKASKPVEKFDSDLEELAADMLETMRDANGIGLAAPQIGELFRLIVLEIPSEADDPPATYVVCNPEVTKPVGEAKIEEGCLSVPGLYVEVDRAAEAEIKGQNLDGTPFSLKVDGLLAICFQHEIDHLDGKLIVHYVSAVKREMYRSEVKRRQEAGEQFPETDRSPL